jgi:hypothetical protein
MDKKNSPIRITQKIPEKSSHQTTAEIKNSAEKDFQRFKGISNEEPSDLTSGDMEKIIRGDDDDE